MKGLIITILYLCILTSCTIFRNDGNADAFIHSIFIEPKVFTDPEDNTYVIFIAKRIIDGDTVNQMFRGTTSSNGMGVFNFKPLLYNCPGEDSITYKTSFKLSTN